jgi:hypothetical protein
MAAVKFEGIFQIIETLTSSLVTAVDYPAISV